MILFSTLLFLQSRADVEKYALFNFSVGINGNWMINDENFINGFTGFGLLLEPRISEAFSIAISVNSMNTRNKPEDYPEFRSNEMNNINFNLLLRSRWYINKFAFYPELGFGGWGRDTPLGIIGVGIEYNIW